MVLLIIIPMKNGYFIGNINPTFSDKPMVFFHGPTNALNELRITIRYYKGMWTTRIPPNTLKWTLRFLLNTLELGCLCISHSWYSDISTGGGSYPVIIPSNSDRFMIAIYIYMCTGLILVACIPVTLLLVKSPLYLLKSTICCRLTQVWYHICTITTSTCWYMINFTSSYCKPLQSSCVQQVGCVSQDMRLSENRVPLDPLLIIIIPIKLRHLEGIPIFSETHISSWL